MYTRTYFTDESKVQIPENYDGNAFIESRKIESDITEPQSSEDNEISAQTLGRIGAASFFEKIPLKGLGGLFPFLSKKDNGSKPTPLSFGTEEILISIIALYMFFSKDGDKECALMLLFLLFI